MFDASSAFWIFVFGLILGLVIGYAVRDILWGIE